MLTVCTTCLRKLIRRQLLQDQQVAFTQELARFRTLQQSQHALFEQELNRHRLFQHDQALRLNFERTYLTAQLQAARMGLTLNLRPRREPSLLKILRALVKAPLTVVRYAWNALRGDPPAGRV